MGGRGTNSNGYWKRTIQSAKSGSIPVTREDVQDIQEQKYGILTERLTPAERTRLANIVSRINRENGDGSRNSQKTINDIKQGNIAQINISQMNPNELETFAKYAVKVSTTASQFAFNDALRLISWKNR